MIYWELFLAFFQIGLISFGGGYAALAPIQDQVVTKHAWLTMTEFTDLITISQMTPGPIVLNSATFVGLQIAGLPGAIMATLGSVMPSLIIAIILGYIYFRYKKLKIIQNLLEGIRPTIIALIASAGLGILINAFWAGSIISIKNTDFMNVIYFGISFYLLRKFKIDPTMAMVITGGLGIAFSLIT